MKRLPCATLREVSFPTARFPLPNLPPPGNFEPVSAMYDAETQVLLLTLSRPIDPATSDIYRQDFGFETTIGTAHPIDLTTDFSAGIIEMSFDIAGSFLPVTVQMVSTHGTVIHDDLGQLLAD